jgi:tripartite-type tricarboxylate transporter receptor subunit TctC
LIRFGNHLNSIAWLALLFHGPLALAQDYPVRPLRLVTIFAPGAAADHHARFIAGRFSEQLSQQVIVENKAGAGGLIGTREALRSQPYGYTLLLTNPSFVGNTFAYKDPGYKLDDFATVGVVGQTYYGMMVHTSVPGKTLAEFVAYAKTNPGKLNYGRLGPAAGSAFSAERFKQAAGVDMMAISYKGGESTTVAMLSGEIQVYFATLSSVKPRMQNPQIKVFGITAPQRSSQLPDVPTFKELGYPTVLASNWNAIMVPSVTPPAILRRLREVYVKAAATPEMKATMESQAYEPWSGTLEQFAAGMRAEAVQLADDYKRLNIQSLD